MSNKKFLDVLSTNFRHEKSFLIEEKLNNFEKVSKLKDDELNQIQKASPLCTSNNLKKIRAIAIFVNELSISPYEAQLLLHCGISSIKSLSRLNPNEVKDRIGRLERILRVKTKNKISLPILKNWIRKADQINKSSLNLG